MIYTIEQVRSFGEAAGRMDIARTSWGSRITIVTDPVRGGRLSSSKPGKTATHTIPGLDLAQLSQASLPILFVSKNGKKVFIAEDATSSTDEKAIHFTVCSREGKRTRIDHFRGKYRDFEAVTQRPPAVDTQTLLQQPVQVLGLSKRAKSTCRREGIKSVQELVSKTPDEILDIRNCGRKTLNEFREKLWLHNLKFRND